MSMLAGLCRKCGYKIKSVKWKGETGTMWIGKCDDDTCRGSGFVQVFIECPEKSGWVLEMDYYPWPKQWAPSELQKRGLLK